MSQLKQLRTYQQKVNPSKMVEEKVVVSKVMFHLTNSEFHFQSTHIQEHHTPVGYIDQKQIENLDLSLLQVVCVMSVPKG
jgi:hypothetical protein